VRLIAIKIFNRIAALTNMHLPLTESAEFNTAGNTWNYTSAIHNWNQ